MFRAIICLLVKMECLDLVMEITVMPQNGNINIFISLALLLLFYLFTQTQQIRKNNIFIKDNAKLK